MKCKVERGQKMHCNTCMHAQEFLNPDPHGQTKLRRNATPDRERERRRKERENSIAGQTSATRSPDRHTFLATQHLPGQRREGEKKESERGRSCVTQDRNAQGVGLLITRVMWETQGVPVVWCVTANQASNSSFSFIGKPFLSPFLFGPCWIAKTFLSEVVLTYLLSH